MVRGGQPDGPMVGQKPQNYRGNYRGLSGNYRGRVWGAPWRGPSTIDGQKTGLFPKIQFVGPSIVRKPDLTLKTYIFVFCVPQMFILGLVAHIWLPAPFGAAPVHARVRRLPSDFISRARGEELAQRSRREEGGDRAVLCLLTLLFFFSA